MLKLARENVPQASFIKEDMTRLGFKNDSFDGLTAFYSIIHVPREKHSRLFHSFHRILKPNGIMLVSMGLSKLETIDEHLGTDMFWSYYSSNKSLRLVKDAGFQIMSDKPIVLHYWILAKNK